MTMNDKNDNLPLVVVLLAAYNGIKWIEEQVKSILSQQCVSVKLVISVDTSNDGTESWVANLADLDARVTILPDAKIEGAAAGNFFRLIADISADTGDYFAFADQDDIWFPDKLVHAINVVKEKAVDAYSGNVLAVWDDGRTKLVNKAQPQKKWDYLFESAGPGCTYVFSKTCYEALHNFVVSHQNQLKQVDRHDWFCYAFSRSRGYKWYIDPQPKMYYRQHNNNHVGVNLGIKAIASRLSEVKNGWWLGQVRVIVNLLELQSRSFVKPWIEQKKLIGRFYLLKHVFQYRRRAIDVFFMVIAIALLY